jgi:hypothetical protein
MEKDHPGILLEDIRSKFDLVIEGHDSLNRKLDDRMSELNEKIEHNSFILGVLNGKIDEVDNRFGNKIDAVSAGLSAHRLDTESHHGVYRVKES